MSPAFVKSVTAINEATEVSLINTINSFAYVGRTALIACGKTILKSVCRFVKPKLLAASV